MLLAYGLSIGTYDGSWACVLLASGWVTLRSWLALSTPELFLLKRFLLLRERMLC